MGGSAGLRWVAERLGDLHARLAALRLPSIGAPTVAAASVPRAALRSLEEGALRVVGRLMERIDHMLQQLARFDASDPAALRILNRRLTLVQLQTDALFRSVDLFNDAAATRCDTDIGLLLAGTDRLIAAALDRDVAGYRPPRAVSYLDSATRGGAITRARTRLPGGVVLPLAMVRVSPETLPTRLTSVLHESGHQLSVDLHLLEEGRTVIRRAAFAVLDDAREAALWAAWTSELMADLWAYTLGAGAPAIDGLQRVLSLPGPVLYLVRRNDPHPPGAVRVPFALALCRLIFPDPLLRTLAARFEQVYGAAAVPAGARARIRRLAGAAPAVAQALIRHRFEGLARDTVLAVSEPATLAAARIRRRLLQPGALTPARLAGRPPLEALAVLGYARLLGRLTAAQHDQLGRAWLAALARCGFRRGSGRQRNAA